MYTFIAHHSVADFEKWINWGREGAANTEMLAEMGIVESHVYRTVDGTGVVVIHHFDTLEAADKFMAMAQSAEHYTRVEEMGGGPPFSQWLAEEVDL